MTWVEIVVAALVVIATIFVVAATMLQLRANDALTRVNLLGPLVCLAFPTLIVAKLIWSWANSGFRLGEFLMAVIAVAGVWIVGSVASFVMGRAVYGVAVVDPRAADAAATHSAGTAAGGA